MEAGPARPACCPCRVAEARAPPTVALVRRRRRRHTCRLLLRNLAALCPALLGPCMSMWVDVSALLRV